MAPIRALLVKHGRERFGQERLETRGERFQRIVRRLCRGSAGAKDYTRQHRISEQSREHGMPPCIR
jgi:hypothetical protein